MTRLSTAPLYQQVKEMLQQQIAAGKLQPGDRIPSERELCQQLGMSRTTIRQALSEAVNEGLLLRVHGKGTFVAHPFGPNIDQELFAITSFERTMRASGLKPSLIMLEVTQVPVDMEMARLLDMRPGTMVLRIDSLGTGNEIPMVLFHSWLPSQIGLPLLDEARQHEADGHFFSLYELHAQHTGQRWVTAHQTFEAALATAEQAHHLQIEAGAPVFMVKSVFESQDKTPIEYRRAVYRADRYRFHVTRKHVLKEHGL